LPGIDELFRSGSIDQNRSSVNWPLAKVLQRHGDAESGFNRKIHVTKLKGSGLNHGPSPPKPSTVKPRILNSQEWTRPSSTHGWPRWTSPKPLTL